MSKSWRWRKPCGAQTSISRYFGGGTPEVDRKSGAQQSAGSKQKRPAPDESASTSKHARLSPRSLEVEEELVEELEKLQEKKPSSSTEPRAERSRGEGRPCSSTLDKLRSFTSTSEPGGDLRRSGTGGEEVVASGVQRSRDTRPPEPPDQPEVQRKDEEEEEEEEEGGQKGCFSKFAAPGAGGPPSGRGSASRRSKAAFTPLELQVLELKKQHQDALLAVECGYKYRFFGDDAEIAAKELNIFCHLDHNFMTCSIPTHRLFVHLRRLVSRGHKVGVVKQTETSALKASGANRNALFSRQLSALYTKSTLVGEDVNPACGLQEVQDGGPPAGASDPPDSFLLCISESWDRLGKQLTVGLVAVQPSTGDVLLDCFPDGPSRSQLEGRVLKIQPVEVLVPSDLSEPTRKLLQSLCNASVQEDDRVRVETRDGAQFEFTSAMNAVTDFYCHNQSQDARALSSVVSLESPVICCLGPLILYLKEFHLERVLRGQSSFRRLTCESGGMILGAVTLKNLEVLKNQTDGGVRGSLLWVVDHTCTPFGRRLMRQWVSRPLTDLQSITERQDAVEEILQSDSVVLNTTRSLLLHLPDLEKGVCSIFHRKSSTQEFYLVVSALSRLGLELQALQKAAEVQLRSRLIRGLLLDVPALLDPAHSFLKVLNQQAARSGDKTEIFSDLSDFPVLQERNQQIQSVLDDIRDHRKDIRLALKAPAFEYTTVSGQEFLIEVKNSLSSSVPSDWSKISSTKAVSRYHSPFLVESFKKLQRLREQRLLDCQREWSLFMDQFGEHYHTMKRAISHLATVDCLFSLAEVAKQGDYCRPEVCAGQRQIVIRDGRHPAVDLLMGEQGQYVPNHTELQAEGRRALIITGPNMGGKSSYIRQVALICIMAQMGSYVPSSEARLGILDGIYARMGASDNICRGRSTFMEELTEASEIISSATERSLVILDELGRGTSTHDGIAIAYAALEHFIRDVRSITLFVTHYPPLCELERLYPHHVSNYHMAFLLNEPDVAADSADVEVQPEFITFLYQLTEGAAGRSYGLNVARLADIPAPVLQTAALKARELENTIISRRRSKKLLLDLWSVTDKPSLEECLKSIS